MGGSAGPRHRMSRASPSAALRTDPASAPTRVARSSVRSRPSRSRGGAIRSVLRMVRSTPADMMSAAEKSSVAIQVLPSRRVSRPSSQRCASATTFSRISPATFFSSKMSSRSRHTKVGSTVPTAATHHCVTRSRPCASLGMSLPAFSATSRTTAADSAMVNPSSSSAGACRNGLMRRYASLSSSPAAWSSA